MQSRCSRRRWRRKASATLASARSWTPRPARAPEKQTRVRNPHSAARKTRACAASSARLNRCLNRGSRQSALCAEDERRHGEPHSLAQTSRRYAQRRGAAICTTRRTDLLVRTHGEMSHAVGGPQPRVAQKPLPSSCRISSHGVPASAASCVIEAGAGAATGKAASAEEPDGCCAPTASASHEGTAGAAAK